MDVIELSPTRTASEGHATVGKNAGTVRLDHRAIVRGNLGGSDPPLLLHVWSVVVLMMDFRVTPHRFSIPYLS
jgi:hypothetical protein